MQEYIVAALYKAELLVKFFQPYIARLLQRHQTIIYKYNTSIIKKLSKNKRSEIELLTLLYTMIFPTFK